MNEQIPSPFTCAKCGKIAMWEEIAPATEGNCVNIKTDGTFDWWLNFPCECGSQLFKVNADANKFIGSYGTGE
jgi:hypothetical protein